MRMPDETLDHLAETFIGSKIGAVLKITFYQYAARPEMYDNLLAQFNQGKGINIQMGLPKLASLH